MTERMDELDQLQARLDALREAEGTSPTGPERSEEGLGAEALAKRLGQVADGSWLSFPA